MCSFDRTELRKKLSEGHIRYLKDIFLENPFPTCGEDFLFSVWNKWLDRIESGKDAELKWISEIFDKKPDADVESYVDEISEADSISNDMYAAMCVHIWSKFENIFKRCISAWNIEATNAIEAKVYVWIRTKELFSDKMGISLGNITEFQVVNAVRVLSNCYKHSNGRYSAPPFDPIDQSILRMWNIEENHIVDYLKLPMKEILLKCGKFVQELQNQIRQKINLTH